MKYSIVVVIFFLILFNSIFAQADFPPCEAYSIVGKDTIRAVNSHSNVLYAGIDNYISINPEKVPFKKVIVKCPGSMIIEDDPDYIIIPRKTGLVKISIFQYDKGDTVLFFEKQMFVNSVPSPYVTFDGEKLTNIKFLEKGQLFKIRRFEVHLTDDIIDDKDWYRVKEITVGYSIGELFKSKTCDGPVLSNEIVAELAKLPPGKEVSIAFTIAADGDFIKRVPPIRIKLY